jgi:hypothetical protein
VIRARPEAMVWARAQHAGRAHWQASGEGDEGGEAVEAYEVVVEADVHLGLAWVALPAGSSEELSVDAAFLVAFGADDGEPSESAGFVVELDVGAAASHVGGDGDGSGLAGLGDDLGFLGFAFGVEDAARDAFGLELAGDAFAGEHAAGADEDGLTGGVYLVYAADDGVDLVGFTWVVAIGAQGAGDGLVGGDSDDGEAVGAPELVADFEERAGHAAEVVVALEEACVADAARWFGAARLG